jgi:hypothetical protein
MDPILHLQAFFRATHFAEEDVFSLELLYKLWLSFNLHPDELSVLRSLLQSLLDASSSLPTWQNHPTYSWITFQSRADLETVRSMWKAWLDIGNETGEFAHLGGETKLRETLKALRMCNTQHQTTGEALSSAAAVEVGMWHDTGLMLPYAEAEKRRGKRDPARGLVANPTLAHELTFEVRWLSRDPVRPEPNLSLKVLMLYLIRVYFCSLVSF